MTAIIVGATGLVGSHLLDLLLLDERFQNIVAFSRRSLNNQHPKLKEHIIDFNQPSKWQELVRGDILFSTLGTTLKQAGSKGAQFKVDYTFQYQFAKAAAYNNVPNFVLVSAAYASPQSRFFYSRMKGELDRDIQKLNFKHISILKPGFITGDRKEKRWLEKLSLPFLSFLHHMPGLHSLKPIPASIIAKGMVQAAFRHPNRVNTYELLQVFHLAHS